MSAEVSTNPTSSKATSDRTAITSLNGESKKKRKNKRKTLSKRVKKKNIERHKTKTGEGKINATKLVHKKKL